MVFYARGLCAVAEEFTAVLLGGDGQADGVLLRRNGAVAHDAVEAKVGNAHVLTGVEHHRGAIPRGAGIEGGCRFCHDPRPSCPAAADTGL